MKQLLITDEDPKSRMKLGHYMAREGFRVLEAQSSREAVRMLERQPVDLVIMDSLLPEVDGQSLFEYTRKHYDIPIMLMSDRGRLSEKELNGLGELDDYVAKPFEPSELLFRVKALFRRHSFASSDRIRYKGLVIDRKNYEVIHGDQVLLLPRKEFELLAQLAEYPGRVFSRDELIHLVWGSDYGGDERTVDVHIKRLRQRFSDTVSDFHIHTVRGIGYKLEAAAAK